MAFTLKQLGYFVAIAEAGSVKGAAEKLFVSESALASALGELEKAVGSQLCVRQKSRGISLTQAGTEFLDGARGLLASSDELARRVAGAQGEPAGPYRFGTFKSFSPSVVPPLLRHFKENFPKVEASFAEGTQDDLEEMLLLGHIEAALMYDLGLSQQLASLRLQAIEPRLVLPVDHRLAGRTAIELEEMVQEDLVLVRASPNSAYVGQLFSDAGLRPAIRHVATDSILCRALVAAGLGYSVLIQPPFAPSRRMMADVVEVPIHPRPAPISLSIVTRRGGGRSAKNRVLVEFLQGWAERAFQR